MAIKHKILVADDEEDLAELICDILKDGGFIPITAYDGEEALKKVYSECPDLLLLDVELPKIDGFTICKKIREDILFNNLPIIMLTVRSSDKDIITGWEKGADDYIVKPFKPKLLLARITAILNRSLAKIDANPLTRLPGNAVIIRILDEKLKQKKKFAVLYIDLNNFKAFNDYYGYLQGDKVIQNTARIILDALKEKGTPADFLGHIGGDDFIAITSFKKVKDVCEAIIKNFDKMIPELYDEQDRRRGYIEIENRQGEKEKFPLMGIVIGVVTNVNKNFSHIGELCKVGTELKRYAKQKGKSCYIIDRRKK